MSLYLPIESSTAPKRTISDTLSSEKAISRFLPFLPQSLSCVRVFGQPPPIDDARAKFWQECLEMKDVYGLEMITKFFCWYSEPNQETGRMLKEECKHWSTKARLKKWAGNAFTKQDEAASIRLARSKGVIPNSPVVQQQQAKAAAEREAADRKREEELAKAKAGAMSPAEFLATRATGALANIMRENEEKNKQNQEKSKKKT